MPQIMDEVKEMQDDFQDHVEDVRKGDFEIEVAESDEEVPDHEVDHVEVEPPTKEELGRYQVVGKCRCCQAMIYVEEYNASLVKRPALIYTCSPEYCWAGYDERDVKWSPSFFAMGMEFNKLRSKIDGRESV